MSIRRRSAMTLAALVLGIASSLALVPSTQVAALPLPSVPTQWGHPETLTPSQLHTHPLDSVPTDGPHAAGARSVAQSRNWAGVIDVENDIASQFTGVSGNWTVPAVQATENPEASATWIGLDGTFSNTLIQTGTAQNASGGATGYFAWYELIPDAPVEIGGVSPGDQMSASIQETAAFSDMWTITIEDLTAGHSFTTQPVSYPTPGLSAEWIEEAPTSADNNQVLQLANFGSVNFTGTSATATDPGAVTVNPVQMINDQNNVIANPTNITSNSLSVVYVPPPQSYDLVGSDGGVFAFNSPFVNSLPGLGVHVNNITGIVPTATDTGYYLVGSDGGVFAFNAPFVNSLPGIGVRVNNIVGIVPTVDDQGYFLVGSDGGVFAFNAPFEQSLPGIGVHVNDITGIAATPDDQGYWLVGSNGNVYAFGNAPYFGNAPGGARGITATGDGEGYWVVGSNGAVTPFGDAGNFSDLPNLGVSVNNIVGIVVTPDSQGYNLIGSDGGVFSFGDAENLGSLPGLGIRVNNVVGAVPT
jgi:hypothetical protein